jgi:NADH-quinone oxidoreductase subunit J
LLHSLKSLAIWLQDNWMLVVPVAASFVVVWSLLPQGRRRPVLAFAAVGVAAIVVAGLSLLRATGHTLHDILFCIFAGMAVLAAAAMIVQKNPVHAALWFALTLLSTSGLFLLRSASFLAGATIIIYAGAIVVTFLFVIMLAQQSGLAEYDRRSSEPLLACIAGFVLLTTLFFVLNTARHTAAVASPLAERAEQARSFWAPVHAKLLEVRTKVERQASPAELRAAMKLGRQGESLAEVFDRGTREANLPGPRERQRELFDQWSAALNSDPPDHARLHAVLLELDNLVGEVISRQVGSELSLAATSGGAGHVTGVGRSLFGDYLYAVEMAAMLLLVATIGAIIIASRRREEAA